jgi:hypothetical protein
MNPPPPVSWSSSAVRELPGKARGRRLLVDYFAARCCGRNFSVGDLHVRWTSSLKLVAADFVPLEAPAGIEAYVQRDLVRVLDTAGAQVAMVGWGPLRRPVVELADGALWLDFIGACRNRSPLRH